MLKECIAGVLIFLKCQNKIWLGSYIVENVKIKVGLRYGWGVILFKKQKEGTAGVYLYGQCWNKVLLGFYPIKLLKQVTVGCYIVENAKIRYG